MLYFLALHVTRPDNLPTFSIHPLSFISTYVIVVVVLCVFAQKSVKIYYPKLLVSVCHASCSVRSAISYLSLPLAHSPLALPCLASLSRACACVHTKCRCSLIPARNLAVTQTHAHTHTSTHSNTLVWHMACSSLCAISNKQMALNHKANKASPSKGVSIFVCLCGPPSLPYDDSLPGFHIVML